MNDYIKREDAIKSLGDAHFKNYGDACIVISNLPSADVVEREEAAKAVDKAFDDGYCKAERTERKRGEWIYHEEWQRDGECAYEPSSWVRRAVVPSSKSLRLRNTVFHQLKG